MSILYFIGRYYPIIALGVLGVCFQLGLHHHRRKESRKWVYATVGAFFVITSLTWLFFRGDRHSDRWLKELFPTDYIQN